MNSVFLRDSTAVSDSMLLLFGGSFSKGAVVSISFLVFADCVIFLFGIAGVGILLSYVVSVVFCFLLLLLFLIFFTSYFFVTNE